MRAIAIPALVALGIGLAGTSPTLAAPANGEVIGQAAHLNPGVEQVYCAGTIGIGGGIAIIVAGGSNR
jgi:hypothetical protein